jgi:hypothetical protein
MFLLIEAWSFLMKKQLILAAGILAIVSMPFAAHAQGVVSGTRTITEFSAQEKKDEGKKAAPAQRAAPQRAAPQRSAPQQRAAPQRSAPRIAAPRSAPQRVAPRVTERRVAPQRSTTRATTRRTQTRTATPQQTAPRSVTRSKTNTRVVKQPNATPKATTRSASRVITPRGTRAVTASRLRSAPARGAGRTVIRGQNYSVWRSGYRVRRSGGWRTFVALSTLSAIMIGSNEYYPYAYVTAPEDYCQGLTADGCELNWDQVQTVEGDVVDQCVAYCPWQ